MPRSVVFVGNCQLGVLAHVYRQVIGDTIEDRVSWLPAYQPADPDQCRMVATCDILVRQVLDFVPRIGDLDRAGAEFLFPHVSGAFLWPYSGAPHPRNAPAPFLDEGGAYPAELGDAFLDGMIRADVPPAEAVARYRETDVATVRRVDRLAELVLHKQRQRDTACGYAFADLIESRFRTERLFRTQNHPEVSLTLEMAAALFVRMGVPEETIAAMQEHPPGGLFPPTEAPLHASVIAHFGLSWVSSEARYRYFQEGSFSFAEFAERYLGYVWNPLLAEAFHWFWAKDHDRAVAMFERALPLSPRSDIARAVYADLLIQRGRLAEAEIAALEAAVIAPREADHRARLGRIAALRVSA